MRPAFETVDRIELRVGALPRSPNNAAGYACNWFSAGLVNEYLNDGEQLRGGEVVSVPSLSDPEVVIDGARYEAFTTSGGLGTMCETFAGRVDRLDYKTIRYPGHCRLMRFMLLELGLGRQRGGHAAPRGRLPARPGRSGDRLRGGRRQLAGSAGPARSSSACRPRIVAGATRTAIAWTTAAGAVGMVELLAEGSLPDSGFVRQEDVSLDAFLATSAGQLLARDPQADARRHPADAGRPRAQAVLRGAGERARGRLDLRFLE